MVLKFHKRHFALGGIFLVTFGVSFYLSTKLFMTENREMIVPEVRGFLLKDAERILKQRKLGSKIEKYEDTSEYPANTVISQSIEPGTIVKENRMILLHVSKVKESVEVPDLIGMDFFEANKLLEKEGLKLLDAVYSCHEKAKKDKVIGQNPHPGEPTQKGGLQLLVSTGSCSNQYVIGDLSGSRVDAVLKNEFLDKGIDVKQIPSESSNESRHVKKQEPTVGSIVKSGDNVVLLLE